ncbi:MAG: iron-containing alcohol dehydrogenase [Bryobacterales bacterium]|nr:iron-containing alcohol dehydrogenase [Bryobacterales bacterium]
MTPFTFPARTRVVFGAGCSAQLGSLARELNAARALLVSEHGIAAAGHTARAAASLATAGIESLTFSDFAANPNTDMAEKGRIVAGPFRPDLIIGLGGGSSLDLAKAISFVLTNGGSMRDYWGYGKNTRGLIPLIAVPTTTGTGSEAQSYALISDAQTHRKMACGTPGAAPRIAILDPELCLTQPFDVRATSGFDAIAHAVETWVTARRTPLSGMLSLESWRILSASYERFLSHPEDIEAVSAMQWGSYVAGWAIEQSMLGAAHACSNPLTQRYGTVHGRALAILLPHVVRWNADARYSELAPNLAERLTAFAAAGKLPSILRQAGATQEDLPELAERAAEQWTGRFNPRAFDAAGALEIYRCAY